MSANDLKFPYLFYMNETKAKHNESTFFWNEGDVFGSKHITRSQKGVGWISQNQTLIFLLPFKSIIIMTS